MNAKCWVPRGWAGWGQLTRISSEQTAIFYFKKIEKFPNSFQNLHLLDLYMSDLHFFVRKDLHAPRDAELLNKFLPLSLILTAMRVKSPFSQSALFGFIGVPPLSQKRICGIKRRQTNIAPPVSPAGANPEAEYPHLPAKFIAWKDFCGILRQIET